jgi:hypothetical protein
MIFFNEVNRSSLRSPKMGIGLYSGEDDTEEHEGFYKFQKLKRISTANLRSLNNRQGRPDTDNLLCLPAEDKFINNLDILDELSEPDSTFPSVSETGESNIVGSCRALPCLNNPGTPVQSSKQKKSGLSMDHRIAESQDCINQLLQELKNPGSGTEPQPQIMNNILSHLRPHFRSIAHIASQLEPPIDKWSAFVHYMAWLGATLPDDATPTVLEEANRIRAGAIAQLSHSLDLWQPQPSGQRRWITRLQQSCNIWQDALHNLQFCSLKDMDSSLLKPEGREELRKVLGLEDLARAVCNHAARFGDQWEENRKKYQGGKANVARSDNHGLKRGKWIDFHRRHLNEPYAASTSCLSSGNTTRKMYVTHMGNVQDIQNPLGKHAVTEEYLGMLKRNCYSMPNLSQVHQWQLNLPVLIPDQTTASNGSFATLKQTREKENPSQHPDEPVTQEGALAARTSIKNLNTSTISQIEIKPSQAIRSPKMPEDLPFESLSKSNQHVKPSGSTFTTTTETPDLTEESSRTGLHKKHWRQIAPLNLRGERLSSPDSDQSWQKDSSEENSSKTIKKATRAWDVVKKYVKEHHESANTTVAAHYGRGGLSQTAHPQVSEISVDQGRAHNDRLVEDSNTICSENGFPTGSLRPRPVRMQSISTAFSDLESYRSSSSSGSLTSIGYYGPVPLPPRTVSMSMPKNFANLESDIGSLTESLHTARNHGRVSLTRPEVLDFENEVLSFTDHIDTLIQAPRIAPVVNVESTNRSIPSEWVSSPPTEFPPPPASSAAPLHSFRHAPIKYIRGATRKRSSGELVKNKDITKRMDVLWHSNRTKAAQAQRLIAERKKAKKEREKKDMEDKKRIYLERVEELEQRLIANGVLE